MQRRLWRDERGSPHREDTVAVDYSSSNFTKGQDMLFSTSWGSSSFLITTAPTMQHKVSSE